MEQSSVAPERRWHIVQWIPPVNKDISVWTMGPRCSVNCINCVDYRNILTYLLTYFTLHVRISFILCLSSQCSARWGSRRFRLFVFLQFASEMETGHHVNDLGRVMSGHRVEDFRVGFRIRTVDAVLTLFRSCLCPSISAINGLLYLRSAISTVASPSPLCVKERSQAK